MYDASNVFSWIFREVKQSNMPKVIKKKKEAAECMKKIRICPKKPEQINVSSNEILSGRDIGLKREFNLFSTSPSSDHPTNQESK